MQPRRRQDGFTLIEVLVVVVVIAIIASIAIIAMMDALDRSRQRATMSDMRTISRAIETYNIDNSFVPGDTGGVAALVPELVPYATSVLPTQDHWGNTYGYDSDGNGNYTIESYGKDGSNGGDISLATKQDFNLDIVILNGQFSAAVE